MFYNGCETWSSSLMEEHRLKVFQNRMLRKIFRPKRSGEDCMKRTFMFVVFTKYHLGDKIKKHEMGTECLTYGGKEKFILSFGVGTEERRQLERPMHL